MKKLILCLLLCLGVTANASLVIVVDIGNGVWENYADSKLTILPSTEILIGILDDSGSTQPGSLALGLAEGPGSLDVKDMVASQNVVARMKDDINAAAQLGVQNPFISMDITGSTEGGMLLRSVIFHCDGPGDVTLYLVDDNGQVVDSQVIHQIPEPMTVALLCLGGLLLRRKIA